jgi:hypothetical protein
MIRNNSDKKGISVLKKKPISLLTDGCGEPEVRGGEPHFQQGCSFAASIFSINQLGIFAGLNPQSREFTRTHSKNTTL